MVASQLSVTNRDKINLPTKINFLANFRMEIDKQKNVSFVYWRTQFLKGYEGKLTKSEIKNGETVELKLQPKAKVTRKEREFKKIVDINCDQCPATFKKLGPYTTHKRRIHLKPHKCKDCSFQFGSKYELSNHVLTKHEGVTFKCNQCTKSIPKARLKRHMTRVHGDEIYRCEICSFKFTSIESLLKHTNKNVCNKTYNCDQCLLTNVSKKALRYHVVRKHEPQNLIGCELCDYKSVDRGSMKKHTEGIHEGRRMYCDLCEFSSKGRGGLRIHKLSIHQNKFHQCGECSYVSATTRNLRRHKEVKHEGKTYKCEECTTETTGKGSLLHHIKSKHRRIKDYMCDKCDYKTHNTGSLKKHSRIHEETLKCEKCPYETHWKSMLKNHTEIQHLGIAHVCGICGARKSRKCYLEQHMKSKHKLHTT